MEKVRIAKYISDAGFASRRGAEDLIERGRVTVNGEKITSPVCFVDDNDNDNDWLEEFCVMSNRVVSVIRKTRC